MAIFPFWVGERRSEAFGWTKTYLFVCLLGKRPYILNLSPIKRKVREKSPFPFLGGGKGEAKPSGGLKLTYSNTL